VSTRRAYPEAVPPARLLALAGAVPVLALLAMVVLGVTLLDAVLLTLVVTAQAWAGGYLWRLVTGRSDIQQGVASGADPVDLLGPALALGTAAAVVVGVVLNPVVPGGIGWLALPAVTAGVWVLRRVTGRRLAPVTWRLRRSTVIGFVAAVAAGLGSIAINVSRYPLGGDGPWTTYHRDMLYFEGLATSTGVFGPNDSVFMAGADVRYHWLAYGWAGQLTQTVGAEPFVVLTRVLPIVALLGCAALVIGWTARLVDRWPATVLAAGLLAAGGYVGATNGTILNFDSPSQNLTTLWLVGALVAALVFLRGIGSWGPVVAFAALMAATTGGKISSGAVALIPLGLVALVMTLRRDAQARRAWLLVGVGVIVTGIVYAALVAGSASPGDLRLFSLDSRASSVQGLDSSAGPRGIMLGTLTLMLAMAARWWGLAWLVRDRAWRWRPDVVLGVGLVIVGLVPVIVLSQGVNETWFALAASAPLAAISAAGVALGWAHVRNRRALLASLALGAGVVIAVPLVWIPDVIYPTSVRFYGPWIAYGIALAGGLAIALVFGRRQWRSVLLISSLSILVFSGAVSRVSPVLADAMHSSSDVASPDSASEGAEATPGDIAIAPVMEPPAELLTGTPPERTSWGVGEAAAAEFVRDTLSASDVLVTNDTTSFLVPALTQRRTYMSGAPYQGLYGSAESVQGIPSRIQNSLMFTRGLDASAFADLCRAGATWGWVVLDDTPLRSWEPYAVTEFENDAIAVIRIDLDRCP
jgi:hypothetical protein